MVKIRAAVVFCIGEGKQGITLELRELIFMTKWLTDKQLCYHLDHLKHGGETYDECRYRLCGELHLALDWHHWTVPEEEKFGYSIERLQQATKTYLAFVAQMWPTDYSRMEWIPKYVKEMHRKFAKLLAPITDGKFDLKPWLRWEDALEELLFGYYREYDLKFKLECETYGQPHVHQCFERGYKALLELYQCICHVKNCWREHTWKTHPFCTLDATGHIFQRWNPYFNNPNYRILGPASFLKLPPVPRPEEDLDGAKTQKAINDALTHVKEYNDSVGENSQVEFETLAELH